MSGRERKPVAHDTCLVVIDATTDTARVAHTLARRTVFVQQPDTGTSVEDLVADDSNLYTVDYTSPGFAEFVAEVIRPLAPAAVVSTSRVGLVPAARANAVLGLGGVPLDVVTAFPGWERPSPQGDPSPPLAPIPLGRDVPALSDFRAITFSTAGEHLLLGVTCAGSRVAGSPEGRETPGWGTEPGALKAVTAAAASVLDSAGLHDGPASVDFTTTGSDLRVAAGECRIAEGDAVLLQRATGLDLLRWSLGWPLGVAPDGGRGGQW
jgi:hypothetical protein